jgi:hypothetical protein
VFHNEGTGLVRLMPARFGIIVTLGRRTGIHPAFRRHLPSALVISPSSRIPPGTTPECTGDRKSAIDFRALIRGGSVHRPLILTLVSSTRQVPPARSARSHA